MGFQEYDWIFFFDFLNFSIGVRNPTLFSLVSCENYKHFATRINFQRHFFIELLWVSESTHTHRKNSPATRTKRVKIENLSLNVSINKFLIK